MSTGDHYAKIQPIFFALDAAHNLDEDFDPSADDMPAANLAGTDNPLVGTAPEEYFQPPIIRERAFEARCSSARDLAARDSAEPDLISDDCDGDRFFAPPIVREQNLRKDEELNALFSELQKYCPILLSDLISALDSL